MAKLVAVTLFAWLMVTVFSMQLVHAGMFGKKTPKPPIDVGPIMAKESNLRSNEEWKTLTEEARKALHGEGSLSVAEALEIIQDDHSENINELSRNEAKLLIKMSNNDGGGCRFDKELYNTLIRLLYQLCRKEHRIAKLYEHVKVTLNHFTTVCSIENSYKRLQRFLMNKYGKFVESEELTLADQLVGETSDPLKESLCSMDEMWWALSLATDPNFGLIEEIKCKDKPYIDKIIEGLRWTSFSRLHEYSVEVFEEHLRKCGHEDRLKALAASTAACPLEEGTTLASFLKGFVNTNDKRFIYSILTTLEQLSSVKLDDKKQCYYENSNIFVNAMMQIDGHTHLAKLLDCVRGAFGQYVKTCNYVDMLSQFLIWFRQKDPNGWRVIECNVAYGTVDEELYEKLKGDGEMTQKKLYADYCYKFWKYTFGAAAELVILRSTSVKYSYRLYQDLGIANECAKALGRDGTYIGKLMESLFQYLQNRHVFVTEDEKRIGHGLCKPEPPIA